MKMNDDKRQALVSVVMPVHNAAKYLRQAMDSILHQTHSNLEFIIINDGSTDASVSIIESIADPRIKLHSFTEKQGLSKALNKGFTLASGEFIARMDADDISLPVRIAEQVKYMQLNPEVGILGTQIIAIGNKKRKLPVTHREITWHLLNACPFLHPSVMLRRETVTKYNLYYDPSYYGAEDLELWVRASHATRLANLPKAYVKYRYHFGMHQAMLDIVARLNTGIKIKHLDWLLPDVPSDKKAGLALFMNRHIEHHRDAEWMEKGLTLFEETLNYYPSHRQELITEFNKCLWFHLSSDPVLYPKVKSILKNHAWFKLSLQQKAWLMLKPILKK